MPDIRPFESGPLRVADEHPKLAFPEDPMQQDRESFTDTVLWGVTLALGLLVVLVIGMLCFGAVGGRL